MMADYMKASYWVPHVIIAVLYVGCMVASDLPALILIYAALISVGLVLLGLGFLFLQHIWYLRFFNGEFDNLLLWIEALEPSLERMGGYKELKLYVSHSRNEVFRKGFHDNRRALTYATRRLQVYVQRLNHANAQR